MHIITMASINGYVLIDFVYSSLFSAVFLFVQFSFKIYKIYNDLSMSTAFMMCVCACVCVYVRKSLYEHFCIIVCVCVYVCVCCLFLAQILANYFLISFLF